MREKLQECLTNEELESAVALLSDDDLYELFDELVGDKRSEDSTPQDRSLFMIVERNWYQRVRNDPRVRGDMIDPVWAMQPKPEKL